MIEVIKDKPLSWKEKKAARDADLKRRMRPRIVRPEIEVPGNTLKTFDGATYTVAPDGSRRRIK